MNYTINTLPQTTSKPTDYCIHCRKSNMNNLRFVYRRVTSPSPYTRHILEWRSTFDVPKSFPSYIYLSVCAQSQTHLNVPISCPCIAKGSLHPHQSLQLTLPYLFTRIAIAILYMLPCDDNISYKSAESKPP